MTNIQRNKLFRIAFLHVQTNNPEASPFTNAPAEEHAEAPPFKNAAA